MKVDIAIMTVREDEFTAVRKRFKTERQRIPGGRTYLIGEVKTEKQTYTIAIARCIDQANDASQRLGHYIIHDLDPRLILVVGIAGGVPRDEFTLGDVVVSTRIVNPNVDAWHPDGTTDFATRGGPPHPVVEDIVSLLPDEPQLAGWTETIQLERPTLDPEQENITGDDEWREKVRQSLNWHFGEGHNRGLPPTFTIGHILSSNHLMKDPARLREILKTHRSILAVEMEVAGVYEAAQGIDHQYPVMAIRGISDIIGLQRDRRWTEYACQTAAAFTYAFIMTDPLDPPLNSASFQKPVVPSETSSAQLRGSEPSFDTKHSVWHPRNGLHGGKGVYLINGKETPKSDEPGSYYQSHECAKCFMGLSNQTRLFDDVVSTSKKVLPKFGLEPWYAHSYFDPTKSLQDVVVKIIDSSPYGIYDLSYWQKDTNSEWVMPRNVFIELGMAIALNQPMLLLQEAESINPGPKLSKCLDDIRNRILPFTGPTTLKKALEQNLAQLREESSKQEWEKLHCFFGDQSCIYREAHPFARDWTSGQLPCYISDGQDSDRQDFRDVIEEVFGDYSDTFNYLDELSIADGYKFLLCTYCQTVRSIPFAIYRITSKTPAETFITIGISIALEARYGYKIPRMLLTENVQDVPSLLAGYKVVVAQNNTQCKEQLREFLPQVHRIARDTTAKSRTLPRIQISQPRREKPISGDQSNLLADHEEQMQVSEGVEVESATTKRSLPMSQKLTLVLMAGLPGAGKSTLAYKLSNDLQWYLVDKNEYRKKFLQQGLDAEKASYYAYEEAFIKVRDVLTEQRASVILDCVGLHDFIFENVMNIVRSVENVQLKVILCVVDRGLRKERLITRPPQYVVINDDPETDADYFKIYKLPKDTLVLRTDKPLGERFEDRTVEECLADAKDYLGAVQYALSQT